MHPAFAYNHYLHLQHSAVAATSKEKNIFKPRYQLSHKKGDIMLFIHFFTFFLFSSFVLKVLPKTGFFAIPSNLLQVEKFNFLWIKLGSNWKQGLQQSFETKQWQTRKKCNIRPIKSLQILEYLIKSLRKGCLPEFFGDSLRYLWDPEVFNWKVLLWFFLAVFPKKLLWPGFLTDVVGEQNVRKVN